MNKMLVAGCPAPRYPAIQEIVEEARRITDMGFPIVAISLLNYLKSMTLVVCLGRLGNLELAGGALAVGFTNITGYSVLSGLAMGMDPICSQAVGSTNLSLASLTLRRTILMLLVASIPIASLWLYLQPLMLLLCQDPDITRIAALYCRFALPDLVANSLLHPIRIHLRSKGTTWPLMWCTLLSTIFHVPITLSLTFSPLSLGVRGVAISSFLTNFISLFFLLSYMYCSTSSTGDHGDHNSHPLKMPLLLQHGDQWDARRFLHRKEWGLLLRLSILSCIGVCLEWWWYEFMTIISGYLINPQVALATAAIVIQTTSLMYTLPAALASSVSTRVGNELGAGRPKKARTAGATAIGLALVASLSGLLWTTVGGEAWARVFAEDPEVVELTVMVLPIIGVCELANCPQTTSCGILRGSARPRVAAAVNLYSFYLVGAPLALLLAFVWELELLGLCYGLLGAQVACVVSILAAVYKTDWERESLKAQDMVGKSAICWAEEDPTAKSQESMA